MTGIYWLASYPKSGNTWLRLVLRSLQEGGGAVDFARHRGFAPIASARAPFDAQLCLASSDLTHDEIECLRPRLYEAEVQEATEPLLHKVHDAWTLTKGGEPVFPPAVTLGIIYVVRDPRDVAVSLAHHQGIDIDQAIAMMEDSDAALARGTSSLPDQLRQRLLNWSGHVESWLDQAPVRKMCLRYEDMTAAPEAAFAQAAAFLGWSVSDQLLGTAVNEARFDRLQAEEEKFGFRERSSKADRFFRRGKAGGWRDSLTPAQAERITDTHGAVMKRLGYL